MAGNTAYKNKYIAENYDRINLTVPKGIKELMKQRARHNGVSINSYIYQLISADLELLNQTAKADATREGEKLEYYLL